MQEIIQQLKTKVGLSDDQAKNAVQVLTDYIGDKFPMIKGQLSSLMGGGSAAKGSDAPQVGGIDLGGLG